MTKGLKKLFMFIEYTSLTYIHYLVLDEKKMRVIRLLMYLQMTQFVLSTYNLLIRRLVYAILFNCIKQTSKDCGPIQINRIVFVFGTTSCFAFE